MMLSRAQIQTEIEQIKKEIATIRTEQGNLYARQEAYEQQIKALEAIDLATARLNGDVPPISEAEIAHMSAAKVTMEVMKRRAGEKLHVKEIFRDIKGLRYKKLGENSTAMVLSRLCRRGIVQREGKGIYLYDPHKKDESQTGT